MKAAVTRYIAQNGVRVYTLPIEVFPHFWGNAYVLVGNGVATLIDAGSGLGNSNEHLLAGWAELQSTWGERLALADLTRIIITHAHIDHFGGVQMLRQHTQAPITMHPLDRRVLTNFENRLLMAAKSLHLFLQRAGVDPAEQQRLMQMYLWNKDQFHALPVEATVEDGTLIDGLLEVIHTPGHCPGQICLRMDEVLFSADHILARTSPHLAPETITPNTGLEAYNRGLRAIKRLQGIELTLGGHEQPITNLAERIAALYASHQRKLDQILTLLKMAPRTVAELTALIHPRVQGYDVLLAVEQVGAHVEYLYLRGYIRPINIDAESDERMSALQYAVF